MASRSTVYRRDLSLTPEVESLGKACQDVDILVNNAGDIPTGTLATIDTATWRKAWDLKVFGYVDLTRIIYPRMCARRSGVIINIVGAAFKRPNPHYIAGCMANIALDMFTQCLGGESMRSGVRVVAVHPGPTTSGPAPGSRQGTGAARAWATRAGGRNCTPRCPAAAPPRSRRSPRRSRSWRRTDPRSPAEVPSSSTAA